MTVKQKKALPIITAGELVELATTQPAPQWVVPDLFRLARGRMSLILGQPEDGKSTICRQMCVRVAQGGEFLGKQCMRAPVLAWFTEDGGWDLGDSLRRLGYDKRKDEPIYVLEPDTVENNVHTMAEILQAHPEIKLVAIETLDDFLQIDGILDNTAAREKFEHFHKHVMRKFTNVSFVALHHLRKNETDKNGQMILGASVIRGKTDNKLYIRRISDDDDRHIIFSQVRKGVRIPKTFLKYDPETESSVLGNPWAEECKNNAAKTEDRILTDMIEFLTHNPNSTKETCISTVVGDSDTKRRVFNKRIATGLFVRSGKGTKTSPYLYSLRQILVEEGIAA